uniref:trafficking protein particle complex subunit 1-like n=1 Tax=Styela clava TaxID=7725 RepID=UPI00193A67DC|nr:trafficking protein particle complex subunit 1-like [Styela clava]
MTVYSLHIFNKTGGCLYEKEWKRSKKSSLPKEQELKLMFGMIHSINSFVSKMSPTDFKDGFLSYTTSAYKLHYYETPTGLKFVFATDVSVGNTREILRKLYSKVYVEYVVRNPLIGLDVPIESSLFDCKLEEYLTEYEFFADQNVKQVP